MRNAPKFGIWEDDGDIAYTQYFEDTRKIKEKGKFTNSRNPVEHSSSVSNDLHHPHAWPPRDISKATDLQFTRREQRHQYIASPYQDVTRNLGEDSPNRRGNGRNVTRIEKREGRIDAGNGHSAHCSPLNPYIPARVANRVDQNSPSRERSDASERNGLAPRTPGRSRLQISAQKDKIANKQSVLPKFGDWDLLNSADGEGYSEIFERVREDKQKELGKGSTDSSKFDASDINSGQKHSSSKSQKCGCFGVF